MTADDMMCCASCGIAAIDDIKLKKCDGGCDLVKYCSDECQEKHREQHEGACKKRLAVLRDRDLFTQPDSCYDDCPICCLPLPIATSNSTKSSLMPCCSKRICDGCDIANIQREREAGLDPRCAFCREPVARSKEEGDKRVMKRIKKKCPVAMCNMGKKHYYQRDYGTALEYFTKAASLGHAESHYNLSCLYRKGEGVEKDAQKTVFHLEEAAIGGHPWARHNLGNVEADNGRFERAKRHFIIAANLGDHDSLKELKKLYADGHASKEDYAGALRAYQAAVDATKSSGRERAEEAVKNGEIIRCF